MSPPQALTRTPLPPDPADPAARLAALEATLDACMSADRAAFLRRLRRLARTRTADAAEIDALERALARSAAVRATRRASVPQPSFDEALPVAAARQAIADAIERHRVVIVCGETGSGKTTQLPKICLGLGRGVDRMIGCTQPRRIAARSVAARIAAELGSEPGALVGYKIRFNDRVSERTLVKVMTDGILLAETHGDRDLDAYDTIVVDEAHERSLNIDFLLGYLKRLLVRRHDLKVVVTSATIDTARFSQYFDGAPVIEASGRTYPVEIRYRPRRTEDDDDDQGDSADAIRTGVLAAVDELCGLGPGGDVLVFLPGEREIRNCAEALRKHHPPHTEILPLYSRLSAQEQDRVFSRSNARRLVLATNVAETSLTVPGIRYVVDTGFARVKRYSPRNKVNMLRIEPISQAAARQRAGRCGRVAEGVCIRLYDETDFGARPAFTTPEILRTSLAAVILTMAALELGDPAEFPFIDPPAPRMIDDAYQLLAELGATDERRALTKIGRELSHLPVDPKIGRILIAARESDCLTEALVLCAALSVQDVRDRPAEYRQAADEAHRRFHDPQSDFLGILKIWAFWQEALQHRKSHRKLAVHCRENFLSVLRLREWQDVHNQLHELVAEQGAQPNKAPAQYEQLHRALLAGLLGQVGTRDPESGEYMGPRQIRFHVAPGSGVSGKPRWIVAAEIAQTHRIVARTVARIEPQWIEAVAGHLLRRAYLDPHWEKERAQVVAYEQATLFGLIVVARRPVHFGPIDPAAARAIFIREGLVAGELRTKVEALRENRRLIEQIETLEHKGRRRDVLVDDEALFAFYDARIPPDVFSGKRFEAWVAQASRQDPKLLRMTREDLMRHAAAAITVDLYPAAMHIRGTDYPLAYRFEPGHPLDGVTVTLPLVALNQVDERDFEWLVPGMLRDKIGALLRGLPQRLRRSLVPIPASVTAALEVLEPGGKALLEQLEHHLKRATGIEIAHDLWPELDDHLRMNYRVVDGEGREVGSGRDLGALRGSLAPQVTAAFRAPAKDAGIERSGLTRWEVGTLPEAQTIQRGSRTLQAWPALDDEGDSVALRLFDAANEAAIRHRAGVRRLFLLQSPPQVRQLQAGLRAAKDVALRYGQLPLAPAPIRPPAAGETAAALELERDLLAHAADAALAAHPGPIRDAATFEAVCTQVRVEFARIGAATIELLRTALAAERDLRADIARRRRPGAPAGALDDVSTQLDWLVYRGFLATIDAAHFSHYPRYLRAIAVRLGKLDNDRARDAGLAAQFEPLWQNYLKGLATGLPAEPLDEYRWQLEELRVGLFAQELKTPYPISPKRLEKKWQEINSRPLR